MAAKSFPWKLVSKKKFFRNIFWGNIFIENFIWLQNHFLGNREAKKKKKDFGNILWSQYHFLENRFARKHFSERLFQKVCLSKFFYGCKMISMKTGSRKKFLRIFFFIVANSVPRKQVIKKNWSKIFMVAKSFPRKQVCEKTFLRKFFCRNFFIV